MTSRYSDHFRDTAPFRSSPKKDWARRQAEDDLHLRLFDQIQQLEQNLTVQGFTGNHDFDDD